MIGRDEVVQAAQGEQTLGEVPAPRTGLILSCAGGVLPSTRPVNSLGDKPLRYFSSLLSMLADDMKGNFVLSFEKYMTVTPCCLGPIHGMIGVFEQVVALYTVLRIECNADADPDGDMQAFQDEGVV